MNKYCSQMGGMKETTPCSCEIYSSVAMRDIEAGD